MTKKTVYFVTGNYRDGSTSNTNLMYADVFADIESAKQGCKIAMNGIDKYGTAKPIQWKELEDGDWYGETEVQYLWCVFRIQARVF